MDLYEILKQVSYGNVTRRLAAQLQSALGGGGSGGGGGVPSYQANLILTNDQIISLPTTSVQLVAAAGENIIIVPAYCFMHLNWVADYDNVGSQGSLGLGWGTSRKSTLEPLLEIVSGQVSNLLIDGASHSAVLSPIVAIDVVSSAVSGVGQFQDDPDPINAALNIYATNAGSHTGNYTGGDEGNSLAIGLVYNKFDITTGLFV